MIVRILSRSASFGGVRYNTNKMDKGKGELMKTANFGPSLAMGHQRPEDYKNYMKMLSAQNKRVKGPQFHAAISAKGRSYDKAALTEIAIQWLGAMGYAEQPYLIVFHNDTENNHVHIVSARVDRNGKKINSDFENIRALQNLDKVLGIDEKHGARQEIEKASAYNFSTKAQFMMILESRGYVLKETGDKLEVIKFGVRQAEIELLKVGERINNYKPDLKRRAQIKAMFSKYAGIYDTSLKPKTIPLPGNYQQVTKGYTSDFAVYLKEKLGLELFFHSKDDKMPYGYSIIDHSGKTVFKGSEIIALKELLNIAANKNAHIEVDADITEAEISPEMKTYYAALLKAVINNYPDLMQGLHHQELNIIRGGNDFILADYSNHVFININELLDENESAEVERHFASYAELETELSRQYDYIPAVNITDDVDDEAIHGRKRRGKNHSHTTSR
jgi:hypothetical protein